MSHASMIIIIYIPVFIITILNFSTIANIMIIIITTAMMIFFIIIDVGMRRLYI
jgi:hypothetical protein